MKRFEQLFPNNLSINPVSIPHTQRMIPTILFPHFFFSSFDLCSWMHLTLYGIGLSKKLYWIPIPADSIKTIFAVISFLYLSMDIYRFTLLKQFVTPIVLVLLLAVLTGYKPAGSIAEFPQDSTRVLFRNTQGIKRDSTLIKQFQNYSRIKNVDTAKNSRITPSRLPAPVRKNASPPPFFPTPLKHCFGEHIL